MKKKKPAADMMAAVARDNQKVSKSRKQYARIIRMPQMFEYLVGERVRVVPGEVAGRVYGVVQKDGYDGLALAFEDGEVEFE
jgi:hypothetical protein